MADTLEELRGSYEDFLRHESLDQVDRIITAIDDVAANGRTNNNNTSNNDGPSNNEIIPRVKISLAELRSLNPSLEKKLRSDPFRHLRALEAACHAIAMEERPGYDKQDVRMKVAIQGPIGAKPLSPRSLMSSSLARLVCIDGVAIKVSAVKPKIVKSVHFCPATSKHQSRDYADATDPNLGLPAVDDTGRELPDQIIQITTSVFPTKDKDKNILQTEFGLSTYKDYQTVTLQEMPEKAPMGQLPRSVELVLHDDLVDRMKPGDRVQVVGVYRALATAAANGQSTTSGLFKTVVLVNNVQILGRDTNQLNYQPTDIQAIRSLSKRNNILSILGKSLAPSIHGHSVIKKSLILQLLSGCEKNLPNGTHLRGDINVLMVGDPSTAKSQLLRSIMAIAPLAISTTGKGSTGVGLTAAVTSDPETRERRLEAGAMVLGDRGIVCVDEFDKMSEGDRVAIHEAMEQQTVTIAKAGIHATLNARCSILAAANPVYGQYDRKRRIQENIGLPDSLLSRFDLLFVVLDHMDPDSDRRIAGHVIQGHRYRPKHGKSVPHLDSDDDDTDDEHDDNDDGQYNNSARASNPYHSIWRKSRYAMEESSHNSIDNGEDLDCEHEYVPPEDILQHEFLRKYLHFAKTRIKPVLTEEAREYIASRYAEMRSRQDERTLPVTARTLETVIRLATAHAKARLSMTVQADPDCTEAMDILSFALYHDHDNANSGNPTIHMKSLEDSHSGHGDSNNSGTSPKRMRPNPETTTNSQTTDNICKLIWEELMSSDDGKTFDDLCSNIQDRDSVKRAAEVLASRNTVMIADNTVYQI